MRLLERLPDAERYEIAAYFVCGALPVSKHCGREARRCELKRRDGALCRAGKLNRLALRAIIRKALRQSDLCVRLPQGG